MYQPPTPTGPLDRLARVVWVVTCARCGHDHTEDSDEVVYRDGDFWCRFEQDCDNWIAGV